MIMILRTSSRRRRRGNNNNNNLSLLLFLQQVLFVFVVMFVLSVSAAEDDDANNNTLTTTTGEDNNLNNNNFNLNNNFNYNNNTCPPCRNQCSSTSTTNASSSTDDNDNDSNSNQSTNNNNETITCQILVLDSPGIITMVDWNAKDYYKYTNGRVKIEIKLASTMDSLYEEIENDAKYGGTLFDAYYTNPIVLGTAATLGGLLDLTEYVKNSPLADWTDVLLALRTYVTSFEDKIYIILLDGDTHTMFYRRDVLDYYNLNVPRTWDEYTDIAKFVHGKSFENKTLNGSCISRIKGDHAMFWSHLVLSTITQTHGTSSGSLFDTLDMTPLTGNAIIEMLRIHENHMKYGTSDELSDIINHVQNGHMNDGTCVMTFMWGDMFRRSNSEGSILHSRLGIAPTPGSTVVLNRRTKKLEKCTKITCPYAKYYPDIGFVNSAPYAANGGWGAAISANTDPIKQKALAEFFIWASSKKQSQQYVIPNSTLPWYEINGQDPWRKSQLDVDKWVKQGYDRELSKQYVESILTNLISKNVVVEIRFPKAGEIMSVLDKEVNEHLVKVASSRSDDDDIDDDEDDIDDESSQKYQQRLIVSQRITDQWNQIIKSYNNRGDTSVPILETYQRLRGVYIPNEEKNYLTKVRPVGLTMMTIIFVVTIFCIVWVYVKRTAPVVRSSQPPFLLLICLGVIVLSSSIIPMGIDDSVTTNFDGASMACMATPWLISLGFCICFAALFSKIYRLKTLMNHAASFRRIQVSVQDVLLPFVIIMILNLIFLLSWTIVDPLYWERVDLGRTGDGIKESYGRCTHSGTVSPIMAGLIATVAIVALILANIQAYQTRELSVAFNESKFVALAMASILQAILIGLPLLFLSDANTTARYLVRCILVFVVCMSVIGFIFLPKILRGDKKDENIGRISAANIGGSHRASWQLELNKEAEASTSIGPRHSAVYCGYSGAENNSTSLGVRFSDVDLAASQQLASNDISSVGGQAAVSKEFNSEPTSSSPLKYGAETLSSEEKNTGIDSDFESIPSSTVDYSDPPQEPSNEASKIQLEAKKLPDPTKIQEEPSTDELEQMETNHQPKLPS